MPNQQQKRTWWQSIVMLLAMCWNDPDASLATRNAYRTTQFKTVLNKLIVSSLGNMCTSAIFVIIFWHDANHLALLAWAVALWLIGIENVITWRLYHTRFKGRTVSKTSVRLLTGTLGIAAALYGGFIVYLFETSIGMDQVILAAIAAAFMGTGSWLFSELPQAGIAWMLGMVGVIVIGFAVINPAEYAVLMMLIGIYGATLTLVILLTSYTFIDSLKTKSKIETQNEVVSLLLRDFEKNASDWLWETDENHLLRNVSSRVAKVFGRPREDLQHKSFIRAIVGNPSAVIPEHQNMIARLEANMSSGQSFSDCVVPYCNGQEIAWWSLTANSLRNSRGEITGWRGVCSDITELRLRDQHLERQHNELVIEKEKAEEANVAKSEFLANMSHELRTPMNGIMGFSELLIKAEMSEQNKKFAEVIHQSGTALTSLLNDILDLSKIEAGKTSVVAAPFSLRATLNNITVLLGESAKKNDIDLALYVDDNIPQTLDGSADQVRQVLLNIIGNAIKFTKEGYVRVRVSGVGSGAHFNVHITVEDSGIGIPAESLETIFSKFTQVESSTTRQYGGTGLGLAISKHLVQAMAGTISVRSEVGKGSVFTIAIPMAYVEGVQLAQAMPLTKPVPMSAPPPMPTSPEPSAAVPPSVSNINGLDIMVVSSNMENSRRLEKLVISWKANPISIGSADQGKKYLELCVNQGRALPTILLDYQVPNAKHPGLAQKQVGTDYWYGFCAHIRSTPSIASIPIVVISSAKDEAIQQNFLALDMVQYLSAPVSLRDVFEAITNTLVSDLQAVLSQGTAPSMAKSEWTAVSVDQVQTSPTQQASEDFKDNLQQAIGM